MNKQELAQFIEWLPSSVDEFKDKTPDEIVTALNKMAQTEEGMNTISGLINQFKQEQSAGMFKQGGKLAYLVNKFKDGGPRSMSVNYGNSATLGSIPVEHRINPRNLSSFFQEGGKTSQRKSDKARKEFHGVDLFEYSPNKWVHNGAQVARSLKPGVNQTVLPNGVGLRQITRNNTTTSELVSPNKKDTLYINNSLSGRIDSNIDDSGILGKIGLRQSTPVSPNFRRLQNIFNTQKFAEGGETSTKKSNITGRTYELFPVDTVGNIVTRKIARTIPNGYDITVQQQVVGYPDSTSYIQFRSNDKKAMKGYPVTGEVKMPSEDKFIFNDKKDRAKYNSIFADLFKYLKK